jgi:hypothetical protein
LYDQIIAEVAAVKGVAVADLPESDRQRARRCATIAIQCEKLEGEAAAGGNIDHKVYSLLSGQLGRNFDRLGLKQKQSTRKANPGPAPGSLGAVLLADIERQRAAARAASSPATESTNADAS